MVGSTVVLGTLGAIAGGVGALNRLPADAAEWGLVSRGLPSSGPRSALGAVWRSSAWCGGG